MRYTELMLRILNVMGSESVFKSMSDTLHGTTLVPQEKESICKRYIEFMFIKNVDMTKLFSEIRYLGKYDLNDETVCAVMFVWKFDDHYGLLSESISELEMKLILMGV